MLEGGGDLIAWDRGVLVKRRIDPVPWLQLYAADLPIRQLMIGEQGSCEVGPDNPKTSPIAVYPTWTFGDDPEQLVDWIENPVGENEQLCSDKSALPDERPVFGQEHRVVITEIPVLGTGAGRKFIAWLRELQEDNPECIIHVHGLYSLKYAFGMGFGAGDAEPRTAAANKRLIMASGNELPYTKVQENARWVTAVGMVPADLDSPAKRCVFNIRSTKLYAMQAPFTVNMRLTPQREVDTETPDKDYVIPSTKRALPVSVKFKDGDRTLCNACSVQLTCKQFRQGEVCSLPEGNTANLASFFQTRDSQKIVDGLGTLLAMQSNRLEQAAQVEQALGDTDPEVTKMINALFSQGVQLAKLVDPSMRGGVKVNVGVINGQASASVSSGATASELTGQVVRALENQGIPRDQITPELVMKTLQAMSSPEDTQRAIEGTVIAQEG